MKKLFLAIVLSATAFGMLNSCEIANDQHYHTYSKEWSYDETNHWREATCEHNDITVTLGEHSWDSGTLTKKPTEEEYGIKINCKKRKQQMAFNDIIVDKRAFEIIKKTLYYVFMQRGMIFVLFKKIFRGLRSKVLENKK